MAFTLVDGRFKAFDSDGNPLHGGFLYTYDAGTTTPKVTYKDKDENSTNTNPIELDSRGEADVWLADANYKVVLKDSDDATIWTVDNIKHINDGSIDTAMIQDSAVATIKIQDDAVLRNKLASTIGVISSSRKVTADYLVGAFDEIIFINAATGPITVTLPSANIYDDKILTLKRIDDTERINDSFVDGDVNTSTDSITLTSHSFADLNKVRLNNESGTLPGGLNNTTDYFVIYVDANTIKLASSYANAEADTAVDITSASGGGTYRITKIPHAVTIDGYLSETVDDSSTLNLVDQYDFYAMYSDGTEWHVTEKMESDKLLELTSSGSGAFSVAGVGDITNMSKTVTTTGHRPVEIYLAHDRSAPSNAGFVGCDRTSTATTMRIRLYKNTNLLMGQILFEVEAASGNLALRIPVGAVRFLEPAGNAGGSTTYKLQITNALSTGYCYYSKMVIREL